MTTFFSGKEFAAKKEIELKNKVEDLKTKSVNPKLVSILVGNNVGSTLYTRLKKEAAEKIGVIFEVYNLSAKTSVDDLIKRIQGFNLDKNVHGIMLQMPLPEILKASSGTIVNSIDPVKDVDGLRTDSKFLHPTSKAIFEAIQEFSHDINLTCVVVGASGMVGTPLVAKLKQSGYSVVECNSKTLDLKGETLKADVLVSATGKPNIITAEMVKDGVAIIDVGYPVGDVSIEAKNKAKFATPVPGGIGPVTITCLLENLIEGCYNTQS